MAHTGGAWLSPDHPLSPHVTKELWDQNELIILKRGSVVLLKKEEGKEK